MIAVKLQGRLGNQLFQYAFAYSAAKKLGVKFYFDKRIKSDDVSKYFNFKLDLFYPIDRYIFSIKGFKHIFSYHLPVKLYEGMMNMYKLNEIEILNSEKPELALKKVKNHTLYSGFFQSEKYFSDFKADIVSRFRIKKKFIDAFKKHSAEISLPHNYVVIHVRRTDYLTYDFVVSASYFHKAIAYIHNEDNFYVFISDDSDFVETEFAYVKNKYISKEPEIIDFQFLMNATTCILSNSSFSWWGAYLNKKKPIIIRPKYWLGQTLKVEDPVDIALPNWITIKP